MKIMSLTSDGLSVSPTSSEILQAKRVKYKVLDDERAGKLLPGPVLDYIKFTKAQKRDEAWASKAEAEISQSLAKLPFIEMGISTPVVQCLESVCEIIVVQDRDRASDSTLGWQQNFIQLQSGDRLGVPIMNSAMLATLSDDGGVAYISYLWIIRKVSD